ncbi:Sterol uptake control protein [Lachnellula suecica]|uniref:Sterol uptake control protein n=1 Tax=Lachnellula suecica TaxID=602035 RepID=A0A8T9C2X0_9HELO|nr:Sterol uptake control protein [Lachnellula suecica]
MAVIAENNRESSEESGRKRKSHKKSRRGCRNCKLRRVKCDEARPECNKCTTFGVTCNYDSKTPDLQMSFGKTAIVVDSSNHLLTKKKKNDCFLINPGILGHGTLEIPATLPAPFSGPTFEFNKHSLDLLYKFQFRTILTLGTARTAPIYRDVSVREAFAHPYLMHIILTLTSIHDRYLSPTPSWKPSVNELYHWSKGVSLINKMLSSPWPPEARDSLWSGSSLLGAIAFSSVDASRPEEAWPLKPSESCDLEWLRMSEGKQAIWKIADPLRPDSAFHALATELLRDGMYTEAIFDIQDLPFAFFSLYGLDENTTDGNNPYYSTIRSLSPLLHMECNHTTIAKYLGLMGHLTKELKDLLKEKDPRALLLLAFWFGKLSHGVWWVARRASLEGQAICIYLEKYHPHETAIMELLQVPKMELGILS